MDREPPSKKSTVGQVGQDQRTLGANDHSRCRIGVGKLEFMVNEVPEIAYAVKIVKATGETVRAGHARPETVCTVHATDEVATIEVFTDADWARDTKSMKSTSSVFTRIDGFTISVNTQLQDTRAQSSGESEFYALGAGCADGLYVKAMLNDLGMQAKTNLRCDAKAARALAQRQGLSKRTRHVKVKYLYESCDRNELGRHGDKTYAESQTGIPQEFDEKQLNPL